MIIDYEFPLELFSNWKDWVFHLETLETKLFPDWLYSSSPANKNMLKVNNRSSKVWNMFKVDSKTLGRSYWLCSGVSIVNFGYISHLFVASILSTLNRYILVWNLYLDTLSTLKNIWNITLDISHLLLLFLLLTLNMCLFFGFDLFIFQSVLD